jgi:F-type H+-transporting ATPase subunit b
MLTVAYTAATLAQDTTEAEPNPILPVWQELVVGGVAFAILCFVLLKFVFPRMEAMYQARVDAIEGGLRRAEERQAEANALFERYQEQLNDLRSEATRIRQDAAADAEGIRQDLLARAREETERIIATGREQLAAERQTIVRELRGTVGALAVELAGKIVGESLEEEARRKGTVDRFLADLDAAPAVGGRS